MHCLLPSVNVSQDSASSDKLAVLLRKSCVPQHIPTVTHNEGCPPVQQGDKTTQPSPQQSHSKKKARYIPEEAKYAKLHQNSKEKTVIMDLSQGENKIVLPKGWGKKPVWSGGREKDQESTVGREQSRREILWHHNVLPLFQFLHSKTFPYFCVFSL